MTPETYTMATEITRQIAALSAANDREPEDAELGADHQTVPLDMLRRQRKERIEYRRARIAELQREMGEL